MPQSGLVCHGVAHNLVNAIKPPNKRTYKLTAVPFRLRVAVDISFREARKPIKDGGPTCIPLCFLQTSYCKEIKSKSNKIFTFTTRIDLQYTNKTPHISSSQLELGNRLISLVKVMYITGFRCLFLALLRAKHSSNGIPAMQMIKNNEHLQ